MQRLIAIGVLVASGIACQRSAGNLSAAAGTEALFADNFESGTLSAWSDGAESPRLQVVTDHAVAQSGRRYSP